MSNNNRACGTSSNTIMLYFRCETECFVNSLIPHVIEINYSNLKKIVHLPC